MTYLILHFLENAQAYDFDNPIEQAVRSKANPEDLILVADNFSDAFMVQQYLKELKNTKDLTVISHFADNVERPGACLSLLNALVKVQDVKVYTNQIYHGLKPIFIRLKASLYEQTPFSD